MSAPAISSNDRHTTVILGLFAAILVILIIVYPDQAFQSSLQGLTLWWTYVFPALMPFLIVTELLLGLGFVHGLGTLLDPLMRLVFRIPGIGGWSLAAGMFAGYPAGADMAAKLRRQGVVSRDEAERLLALTHLCSPVTMITIIGAGFLQQAEAGVRLALVHYAAALLAGLAVRLFAPRGGEPGASASPEPHASGNVAKRGANRHGRGLAARALAATQAARSSDGRAFGKLLGDAVYASTQTLLVIGGFVMVFSVLNRMLSQLWPALAALPPVRALLPGLLEPHIGAFAISQLPASALLTAACISAALGWSGLSLHAQVKSLIGGTDIRYRSFVTARLLHAAFAFVLTFLLWQPLGWLTARSAPVLAAFDSASAALPGNAVPNASSLVWRSVLQSGMIAAIMLAAFILLSVMIGWFWRSSRLP
ncbi:nucleoside recognition domain-containing protein [Paenibacillus sp. MBLB4367]|uniref:nucleoside recognition domain-containing protein n=1 Tax=Paenibacillus sp. MBLB4367 TaxID=3384767 RepID=UPI003907F4BA